MPLHTDPGVGVIECCPTTAPGAPNFQDDLLHPTSAGQSRIAAMMGPAIVGQLAS